MKHLLVLLLLFSFSAFAYDNPYSNPKRWEADDRHRYPERNIDYYYQNQYDQYEQQRQIEAETEREMRDFRDSVERDRY